MSKLTVEEILGRIEKDGITVEEFGFGHFDSPEGVGDWEEISQYGGEGQGDTWYSVKYFQDHDVYIRTNGWYSSYAGTEFWDGYGKEVSPVKRTVTFYE